MQRAASYPSTSGQPRMLAIAGSLLLVSLSYVLLLAAPLITRHFRSLTAGQAGLKGIEAWLPLACGAGLVLGGASALVFVLTQITREAQRRPYVSLAPVVAAFSVCVLIGLRAELPLSGVSSEHVAVFALAVVVVGGSLAQLPKMSTQLLGIACTFLPATSLFGVLWLISGNADPARAIWGLSAPVRAYLGMLTLSSFAIAAIATLGRRGEIVAEEPGLTTRLPVTTHNYSTYDLERSFAEDEAALARRGLPGWVIAFAAGAALVLSFMAVKLYLERRAATSLFENEGVRSTPVQTPTQPSMPEPGTPVVAPQPSEPNEVMGVTPAAERSAEAAADGRPQGATPGKSELGHAAGDDRAAEQPVRTASPVAPAAPAHARAAARASHASKVAPAKMRLPRTVLKAASARKAAAAAEPAPAPAKVDKRGAAEPAKVKTEPAKMVKEDTADIALKAARTLSDTKGAAARPTESKPAAAPSRGDESLDELMDNVLKPSKGGKKHEANDDPIFGL